MNTNSQTSYISTYRQLVEATRSLIQCVISGDNPSWEDADKLEHRWDSFDSAGGLDGLYNEMSQAILSVPQNNRREKAGEIYQDLLGNGLLLGPRYLKWHRKAIRTLDLIKADEEKNNDHVKWLLGEETSNSFSLHPLIDELLVWMSGYANEIADWWTFDYSTKKTLSKRFPVVLLQSPQDINGLSVYFKDTNFFFNHIAPNLRDLKRKGLDGQGWCAVCDILFRHTAFNTIPFDGSFDKWAEVFCKALWIPRFSYHPEHKQVKYQRKRLLSLHGELHALARGVK